MNKKVRVRFAPSPTGGLHLGGVRTVLYNYLFARQHKGDFVLRVEDTDQSRFVQGAEQYIFECLEWCGLVPDESSVHGGEFGPYRQSERKEIYHQYAKQLLENGHAYYAFDTPLELEAMRDKLKATGSNSLQYDHQVRQKMKNSLNMTDEDTRKLLEKGTPYVIRLKVEPGKSIGFTDMIRGEMSFDSSTCDDKVLMKADGMPTYHLAVVVDDYLMKITHAFRGEEWLPSAPIHILLWEHLFGRSHMPHWAHLPLILKPDGNGKLSKRDAERLGFPVFATNWTDAAFGETSQGFKEIGFLPEAFINFLAALGWNDGTEQELFTLDELISRFSIERVHKGGAKFDYEKAKWYNHEWIKRSPAMRLSEPVTDIMVSHGLNNIIPSYLLKVIELIKDRCTLLTDFYSQGNFFFERPVAYDEASVSSKWDQQKAEYFENLSARLALLNTWSIKEIEDAFKLLATEKNIKIGELQMIFRVMLVGSKMGPAVFAIAELLGKEESTARIKKALQFFEQKV